MTKGETGDFKDPGSREIQCKILEICEILEIPWKSSEIPRKSLKSYGNLGSTITIPEIYYRN
jgi:hypothetical protein